MHHRVSRFYIQSFRDPPGIEIKNLCTTGDPYSSVTSPIYVVATRAYNMPLDRNLNSDLVFALFLIRFEQTILRLDLPVLTQSMPPWAFFCLTHLRRHPSELTLPPPTPTPSPFLTASHLWILSMKKISFICIWILFLKVDLKIRVILVAKSWRFWLQRGCARVDIFLGLLRFLADFIYSSSSPVGKGENEGGYQREEVVGDGVRRMGWRK